MGQDYFTGRRSIRHFADKEVSDAQLNNILRKAMKAPTTGNMQLYTVIVNRAGTERSELEACHFRQPASTGAPVLLTICADFYRFTRWCKLRGADAGFNNFLSFQSAYADAMILSQQIVTIAEEEGLGTCYLGTVSYNAPKISELLELPELVVPVACIALGWPAEEGEETERLGLEAIVGNGRYPHFSDKEILELFKEKESYGPNPGYVKENGKENLAQVFAEVRYPRAMNEEYSVGAIKLLKDKKFL
ncbi:MAG: nitroreductase family protein [Clostridium sp.]|nr:nitroreductase family protein [Prevotella sp.]MCM1428658.1 nitroreductase family protein [Clostridium sp.]MCM1475787.1 nitroreductase family protein [Muribaculaceae bacterium]